MLLAQSAYVGFLAILPGLGGGVFLAYVIRISSLTILGDKPHFGVHPWLIPYAVGLVVLVLISGWLLAARAARVPILESIRAEGTKEAGSSLRHNRRPLSGSPFWSFWSRWR
jgi:ABC-type antimicrobial peptide transport system permease subunit